jgi:PLP dependent protein
MSIAERLQEVRAQVTQTAFAAGRNPEDVRIVAVSKTKPASAVREAYAAGQRDFGENYVQELVAKAEELGDLSDLRWHLVGHLQRNKARQALKIISAVHTVDTVRIAQELAKRAAEFPLPEPKRLWGMSDARLPVCVEVNVGGERQKTGCGPEELGAILEAVDREASLKLVGLMTVPPNTDDGARSFFAELARLRELHGGAARLPELSMGMSSDLESAIAEGATIVRIGTAIFGTRSRG